MRSSSLFGAALLVGPDAAEFLHGQISNDVEHMPVGSARLATYNTAQGRMVANFVVLRAAEDAFALTLRRDAAAKTAKRLAMFRLRSKVRIGCLDGSAAPGASGMEADPVFAGFGASLLSIPTRDLSDEQARAPRPLSLQSEPIGERLWKVVLPCGEAMAIGVLPDADAPVGGEPGAGSTAQGVCGDDAWLAYEIRNGMAWIDLGSSETQAPQMCAMDVLGALDFKIGCYPGQEVIARAKYRGRVKRGLIACRCDAPGPLSAKSGDRLLGADGAEAGVLLAAAPDAAPSGLAGQGFVALVSAKFSARGETLRAGENEFRPWRVFFDADAADGDEASAKA